MRFLSGRVAGDWFDYILKSLGTLHQPEALEKFISVDVRGDLSDPGENDMDQEPPPWIQEETERLQTYVRLLVELASARSWSQFMFVNCCPNNLVGLLHEDPRVAQQLSNYQKSIWEGVLLAERYVHDKSLNIPKDLAKELNLRLEDVTWHELQLSREVFIICSAAGWDCTDPKVVELAKRIFSVPWNTKFDLEDLFAHLSSLSSMSSLATAMGKNFD